MEYIINKPFVRLIPPSGFGSTNATKLHTLSFSKRENSKVFICKCESKSDGNLAAVHTKSDESAKENENISVEPKINSLIEPWMLQWTVPPERTPPKKDEQASKIGSETKNNVLSGLVATALSFNPFTKKLLETEALRKQRDQTLFLGETYNLNGEVVTVVDLLEDSTTIIAPNQRPKPLYNTVFADKNFKVENIRRAKTHIIEGGLFISLTNEEVGYDICHDIETMLRSHLYDYSKLGQEPHLAPCSWLDLNKGKVKIMYRCYVKNVDQYTLMTMKQEMFRRAIRLAKLHGGKIILEKVELLSGPTVL